MLLVLRTGLDSCVAQFNPAVLLTLKKNHPIACKLPGWTPYCLETTWLIILLLGNYLADNYIVWKLPS